MTYAIEASHLSKVYRLGALGTGTLGSDLSRWWARRRRSTQDASPGVAPDAGRQHEDEFWALRDVSFNVRPGEVLGIIGRNGAGKSTLLKLLSQVTTPSDGRIRMRGRIASLLEVGTGFHPDLSGRDNIFMNGAILGMTKQEIRRNFDEIVAFSECEAFIDTPVKRYSSGMYVRLAFAVAAHLEPEILIVDEVLAVGDTQFQRKCLGKMRDVSSHGRTVLFVSHSMSAVAALCTRATLLNDGRVAAEGSTADVIAEYNAASVASASDGSDLATVARTGSGKGRFRSVRIAALGPAGEPRTTITPGSDVSVQLDVDGIRDFTDANVAVVIHDAAGSRLIDVNTAIKGEFLSLRHGESGTVTFVLHDLRLRPGTYPVTIYLGRAQIEEIDHVNGAVVLEVSAPPTAQHSEEFPGVYQCRFNHAISRHAASC